MYLYVSKHFCVYLWYQRETLYVSRYFCVYLRYQRETLYVSKKNSSNKIKLLPHLFNNSRPLLIKRYIIRAL